MHRNLSYVTNGHERQKLNLYLPKSAQRAAWAKPPVDGYKTRLPLVIYIHGGGFIIGDKDNAVPLELLSQGYAGASINYRLSSQAKFPAQIEDCKAAVR